MVFPMAERTMTGVSSGKLRMRSATSLIRSADASEEPPNFMTTVKPVRGLCANAAAVASSLLRRAAAAVWQRTTSRLRLQHCAGGLAQQARTESCSLPSLAAARMASAAGDPRATPGSRSATAIS